MSRSELKFCTDTFLWDTLYILLNFSGEPETLCITFTTQWHHTGKNLRVISIENFLSFRVCFELREGLTLKFVAHKNISLFYNSFTMGDDFRWFYLTILQKKGKESFRNKEPVKLMRRVKLAHLFLHVMSKHVSFCHFNHVKVVLHQPFIMPVEYIGEYHY